MQNIIKLYSPSNSSKIKTIITKNDKFAVKIELILFLCGFVSDDFSIYDLFYKLFKYLNPKIKNIDHQTTSKELKSLFINKWNAVNINNFILSFIKLISDSLSLIIPTDIDQSLLFRTIRIFCAYKMFDLSKYSELLLPLIKNDRVSPSTLFSWINKGIKHALDKNNSYYITFSANFMQSQIATKSKLSLDQLLSATFASYDKSEFYDKSDNVYQVLKEALILDKLNTNNAIKHVVNPNNNNYNNQYKKNWTNYNNKSVKPNINNPNNNHNDPPKKNRNLNPKAAEKVCQNLLAKTGNSFSLKSKYCCFYNAYNYCRLGDKCQRAHICIIDNKDHPLMKCDKI